MSAIRTRFTKRFGIEHPICLGPMGLISTPPLVAAAADALAGVNSTVATPA